MTNEVAISYLEPMVENAAFESYREALSMATAALREQEERENPKLLTLDELRKMDGEPVWLQDNEYPENTEWAIWNDVLKECWLDRENTEQYGVFWFAYRSKPKEEIK